MLVKNSFKCLRRKPVAAVLSVLLLSLALCLWLLSFTAAELSTATVPEKHLTIAVPNNMSDREVVYKAIEHIRTSVSQVSDIDRRVALKAYSGEMTAYFPSIAPALVSDADVCVFAVTLCETETTYQNVIGKRYVHNYKFEIAQILAMHDIYRDITAGSEIWVQIIQDMEQEDWAQVGKTYLIWGRLQQAHRNGEAVYQLVLSEAGHKKMLDDGSKHLVYAQNSGELVPTVSEIGTSLDVFWTTEMGDAWQRLILPATNILYHSVDIVGTDISDSIRAFNREETAVVEGEMLTAKLCERGERVCLVSEELAQLNGWSVGDRIPLDIYDGTRFPTVYHAGAGFFFETEYRIVGIYRNTRKYVDASWGVHPNTVYIPLRSIEKLSADVADFALVIESGSENAFETEMQGLGYGGLFTYYSGPEAENIIEQAALEAAREEWITATEFMASRLKMAAVILIALTSFAIMWCSKREIGYFYTIETAERILFGHILLQIAVIGILSAVMTFAISHPLLRSVAPRLLYRLAEAEFADRLTESLPPISVDIIPLLYGLGILLLCGTISAIIGMKRSYYYTYKEGEGQSCCSGRK